MNLSQEQHVVVNHKYGNAVVVAGAGSGKTRCLIERCAKLIESGVEPSSILIFTFTKKAAKEIKDRLIKKLGEIGASVVACTIHSLALRIVREHYEDIGYAQKPVIWGSDKINRLIKNTFDERIKNIDPTLEKDVKKFKRLEAKVQKEDDPMGIKAQSIETQRTDLASRLHNLKMSLVEEFGDDALGGDDNAEETFFNSLLAKDRDFPPNNQMLEEVEEKEHERAGYSTAYFSIDHDEPDHVRKSIYKSKAKGIVNMITKDFRPVPSQISGMELKDAREIWNSKVDQDTDLLDGVVGVAAQVLRGKQACNAIEFDDMIPGAIRALTLNPSNPYTSMFDHVMVDEYQDVNDVNVEFIKLLSANSTSLMVVGDDDQSIYAFRGGNTQHILNFPDIFDAEKLFLTTNYRCVPDVVNFSNNIISNNKNRFDKKMVPHRSSDESFDPIQVIRPSRVPNYNITPKYEIYGDDANFKAEIYENILHTINGLTGFLEIEPSEVAILARNNFQLMQFNIHMSRLQAGMPASRKVNFEFLSSQSVFNNPTIAKIHNWFSFIMNGTDTLSLQEVIVDTITGFGNAAAGHLKDAITMNPEGSLEDWFNHLFEQKRYQKGTKIGAQLEMKLKQYNMLMNGIEEKSVLDIFRQTLPLAGISKSVELSYRKFIELNLSQHQDYDKVDEQKRKAEKEEGKKISLYMRLFEYEEALKRLTGLTNTDIDPFENYDPEDPFAVEPSQEEIDRIETLNRLNQRDPNEYIGKEGLQKFLDEVNTEADEEEKSEAVSLGTMHSSKGKEWKHVFVIGLTKDIIPSPRNKAENETGGGVEEERRLMYVAMTRAKDNLYLCWEQESQMSPFIGEIFRDKETGTINIPQ